MVDEAALQMQRAVLEKGRWRCNSVACVPNRPAINGQIRVRSSFKGFANTANTRDWVHRSFSQEMAEVKDVSRQVVMATRSCRHSDQPELLDTRPCEHKPTAAFFVHFSLCAICRMPLLCESLPLHSKRSRLLLSV